MRTLRYKANARCHSVGAIWLVPARAWRFGNLYELPKRTLAYQKMARALQLETAAPLKYHRRRSTPWKLIYGTRVAEVIPRAIPAIDEVVVHIMSDLLLFFDLGIGRELLVLRVLRVVA